MQSSTGSKPSKTKSHPHRFSAFLDRRGIDRREAFRSGKFRSLAREWVMERRQASAMKRVSGVVARLPASPTPIPSPVPTSTTKAKSIGEQFAELRPGSPEASAFYKQHRQTLLR